MSKKNKKLSPKKGKSGAKKTSSKKSVKKSGNKKKSGKSSPAKKKSSAKAKPIKKKAKVAKAKKIAKPKKLVKKAKPKKAVKKVVAKKAKPATVKKIVAPKAKPIAAVVKKTSPEPKKPTENKVAKPVVQKIAQTSEAVKPIKIIKADKLPVVLDVIDEKPTKEPAGKYELEFPIHCSAPILYEFLTTPSGLSEWFCDDVNIKEGIYSFKWNESSQSAKLLKAVPEKLVRYRWTEKNDGSYFEFRIERDELTNDISLIITDFAIGDEVASSKLLWDSQVDKLLHVLGSYF